MVAPGGIEPPTPGFSVLCSTYWAIEPYKKMAVPKGLEPSIFCVTGRRVNHYTTEPMVAGVGFEPTTFGLWARRASRLLHPAIYKFKWRRRRDSNPCADCSTSRFSRPVPSARLGYFSIHGASGRTWTGTWFDSRRILSPVRLPIPPLKHVRQFALDYLIVIYFFCFCNTFL